MFSEELFGKAAAFNHKTVFGIVSWLIFGALLAGRARLRLARAHRGALDARRVPGARARLHRQQVRARSHPAALARDDRGLTMVAAPDTDSVTAGDRLDDIPLSRC